MERDTKRVSDRRTLRFESLEQLRVDIEVVAAAEREGTLRSSGNWTAGQTFHHLATWINFGFDGMPPPKPPVLFRLVGPLLRGRILHRPLPAGLRLPVSGGTHGTERTSLEVGHASILRAIDRLDRTAPLDRHVLLGQLSHEQWKALHLRHAELHLSFLHP